MDVTVDSDVLGMAAQAAMVALVMAAKMDMDVLAMDVLILDVLLADV